MLEALTSLDLHNLLDGFLYEPHGEEFELAAWLQGLFCADLPTMERMGEMFQNGQSEQALQFALSNEQCANLKGLYDADMKYFGKVYHHGGDYIQIVGVVPHGHASPMSYVFIKLSTLAS